MAITIKLLKAIKERYPLDWYGTHGVIHWSHVYENGMRLAGQNGVNSKVVQLFSVFHDSQRRNEGCCDGHGNRGAQLALRLRSLCFLSDDEFDLLTIACGSHTDLRTHDDITIQACFDADRLDLGRVGIIPDPKYLCTPIAKSQDIINWGYRKSQVLEYPDKPFGLDNFPIITE